MVLLRYALEVSGGIDGLMVTHLDQYDALPGSMKTLVCSGYSPQGNSDITVHRLPVNPVLTDLAFQERLTAFLNTARPVYDAAPVNAADLWRWLEKQLSVPVLFGSYGPTASDKQRV